MEEGAQGLRAGLDGVDGFDDLPDGPLGAHVGVCDGVVERLEPLPDGEDGVEHVCFLGCEGGEVVWEVAHARSGVGTLLLGYADYLLVAGRETGVACEAIRFVDFPPFGEVACDVELVPAWLR